MNRSVPSIAAALLVLVLVAALPHRADAQSFPPAPVVAEPVAREVVAPRRSFVGTVRARQRAVVPSESAGRVVELLARAGDHVSEGQPVARLRTTSLEIQLRAARAELELRRQELTELRNGARAEELAQAEARLAAARSELEFAQWDLDSASRLSASGSISENEMRRARLALRVAEQRLAEAEAAQKLLAAGPRAERIAQAAARAEAQEAAVARMEDDLARRTIRAPFEGDVVSERTEVGEWLAVGAPVAELVSSGDVDVVVGVVEDVATGVSAGGTATITVGALPGQVFEGTVRSVSAGGDDRTRTFPVKVRVRRPTDLPAGAPWLRPGMFARVSLDVGKKAPALLVPKDAVVLGGPAPIVYVVTPATQAPPGGTEGGGGGTDAAAPPTVRPVPVRLGAAYGGRIAVQAELAAGDLVVTRGGERLRPGQPVMVIGAADAPDSPGSSGSSGSTGAAGSSGSGSGAAGSAPRGADEQADAESAR